MPTSSWLAGAQADEQTLDGEIQRGRWALGGCSEFRGNGIVVRRDLLAAVGGWRAEALTEDLDLSSRLAAAFGIPVAWAIDAEVWEEPVRTVDGLWRQRLRWAEGGLRRLLEHGPAVLRSPRLRPARPGRFRRLHRPARHPAGDPRGARRSRPARPARAGPGPARDVPRRRRGAGLGRPALGAPARTADRSSRWSGCGGPPGSAVFNGIWLAAIPAAMWRLATRRGDVGYAKMPHVGGGRGEWVR